MTPDTTPAQPVFLPFAGGLPLFRAGPLDRLWRLVDADKPPLGFGPTDPRTPAGRFDSPSGLYRTAYLGLTPAACLVETLVARDGQPARLAVARLGLAQIRPRRELRLVPLDDASLPMPLAMLASEHAPARALAEAVWRHPDAVDGLVWPSRHDPSQGCVVLFDRCAQALDLLQRTRLLDEPRGLERQLHRYGLALQF